MTMVELTVAIAIMLMVVVALGGLTRTVQQSFEYSEGYGAATQHARVVLDRIAQNACQATANELFPGFIVVAETVGTDRYPDTLVVWRPSGAPASPTGLPRYNELLIYCPHPSSPSQLVEITAPTDGRAVPAADNLSAWQTELTALKKASGTKTVVLTTLLRCASTDRSGASKLRGAVRFETRLRPSVADWSAYKAGTVSWMNLPWAQGIYGSKAGLRQAWLRMELQLVPGTEWIESNPEAVSVIPFFNSAALYYSLPHP